MAQTSRAWVMDVGAGQHAAAGASHVVEYLLATETVPVPRTPRHCRGLFFWRGRMIPVIDLAPLIAEGATAATATRRAVVLAWQERPGEPLQYGALLVTAAPGETWVSDDMAGDLAAAPAAFRHFSQSAFLHKDRLIPILDARRLFGRSLPADLPGSGAASENVYPFSDEAPAANEAVSRRAVAEGMPMLQTLSNAIDLAELQPAADTPAGKAPDEMPRTVPSAMVIPFSAGKAELRHDISSGAMHVTPEGTPTPAADLPIPGEPFPLDEKLIAELDKGAVEAESSVAAPIHDDASSMLHPRSGTVESFGRLRALRQKVTPLGRRGMFRRRAIALAIVLGMLGVGYLAVAYRLFSGAAAPDSAVRDAAPGGIDPHSIPATPAQPPR